MSMQTSSIKRMASTPFESSTKSPLYNSTKSKGFTSDSEFSGSIQSIGSSSQTETKRKRQKFEKLRKKYALRAKDLMRVDEEINAAHLRRLQWIFLNTGKDEGLNIDQFRTAMKQTIAREFSDEELEKMFMKMDANCDGTLEWNEYISYLLLEYQERQCMIAFDQDTPFPTPMEILQRNRCHVDSICKVTMMEGYTTRYSKTGSIEPDDAATRWLTLSRDATLTIWTKSWRTQKSFLLEGPKSVTDMICMSNCNTIAVSTTDYEITFYAIMPHNAQRRFQIKDLKYCALSMDYSFSLNDPNRAILVWGDTNGNIVIVRFCINPNLSLFTSPAPWCVDNTVSFSKILAGCLSGIQAAVFIGMHIDWVKQVRYFKSRQGQESVLSCCIQGETAVFFADVTEKIRDLADFNRSKPQMTWKTHFRISKGVVALTYDPELNLIATGSSDNRVRVWNPHVMKKSMAVLKGHTCAVTFVLARVSEHQIISISKDNNIRVWDLQDFTCKQNIHGRSVNLGSSEITAAYFNNRNKELIIASSKIGIFKPNFPILGYNKKPLPKSHQKPVVRVLYNKLYNLIVTASEDAIVSIWDIKSGEKTMQFSAEDADGVSFMTFDETKRRLLTGGFNGEAVLWNFNNGEKLKTLDRMENGIADGIITREQIMIAGVNRKIRIYTDDQELDTYHILKETHPDEISCLDFHHKDQLLASSSFNGDIFIWSIERAIVLLTYNMYESIMAMNRVSSRKTPKIALVHKKTSSYQSKYGSYTDHRTEEKKSRGLVKLHRPSEIDSQESRKIKSRKLLPPYLPWLKSSKNSVNDQGQNTDEIENDATLNDHTDELFPDLNEHSVYKILFLQNRRCDEHVGSLFSISAKGYVCIWSVHPKGGLLGYFQGCAKTDMGDVVSAIATDEENKILLTGDSRGYIRKWNIANYCNGEMTQPMKSIYDLYEKQISQVEIVPTTSDTLPLERSPRLVMTIRCHLSVITSIVFVNVFNLVITGGKDATVRLWTDHGRYIGTFGQPQRWKISLPVQEELLPRSVPEDLQGVASVKTLSLSKGIAYTHWQKLRTLNTLLKGLGYHVVTGKTESASATSLAVTPAQPDARKVKSEQGAEEASKGEKKALLKNALKQIVQSQVQTEVQKRKRSSEKIEQTFQRLQEEGMKSKVLGKINYKPKKRHKLASIKATIRWSDKHPIVYSTLPYEQLEQAELPVKPQISYEDYPIRRSTIQGVVKKGSDRPLLSKREKETAPKLK